MNNNEESCVEINEIIYRISGEFWKEAYNSLLYKQKDYECDQELSVGEAIFGLKNGLQELAKKNHLKCTGFSHNDHYYMSLVPFPFYIGIEKTTGDFSISAPHISTQHFEHGNYKAGLKWIQDYIDIDLKPLIQKNESVREKFYLNKKSGEIVSTSIKALCESVFAKKFWTYKLNQKRLKSNIVFQTSDNDVYEIEIFHKPFASDASLLINLLNNPCEMKIEDKVCCSKRDAAPDGMLAVPEGMSAVPEPVEGQGVPV